MKFRSKLYAIELKIVYAVLGFMVLAALAVAFTNMYALSNEALKSQADWKHWVNAVLSELLPLASLVVLGIRVRQKRGFIFPAALAVGAVVISGAAQLHVADVDVPGTAQFLAVWPALCVLAVGKLAWAEGSHAIIARAAAAAEAERQAKAAETRAASAARAAAAEARQLAAEQRRQAREDEAAARKHELALAAARTAEVTRLAEIEAAAAERVAAEQRAAEDNRRAAEAERRAENARQLLAEQAADLARRRAAADASQGPDQGKREQAGKRRPAAETQAIVQAALDVLPEEMPRDEVVRHVSEVIGRGLRQARAFVPGDWPATRAAVNPAISAVRPTSAAPVAAGG